MQQQFHRPIFSIFDILDRVLDKGLVIDANISLSMAGIEMGVIRARILAASITTFLRYAAALGLTKAPAIQMPIALV